MPAFTTMRRVEFRDTDAAGIAHFSRFYTWMEEAEHEALRSVGMSVMPGQQTPAELQVGWPRINASCEFKKPLRFEDEVQISVLAVKIGGKSVVYEFTFTLDSQIVATGSMTAVCCRLVDGQIRSDSIPTELRNCLQKLTEAGS